MEAEFSYLTRFVDEYGETVFGNLPQLKEDIVGSQVEILAGDILTGLKATGRTRNVTKVCFQPI